MNTIFRFHRIRRVVTGEAVEDPAGASHSTTYGYDPLGNLLTVTQGEQQRFFLYDSLSRLIRAKNPEQDANPSIELYWRGWIEADGISRENSRKYDS